MHGAARVVSSPRMYSHCGGPSGNPCQARFLRRSTREEHVALIGSFQNDPLNIDGPAPAQQRKPTDRAIVILVNAQNADSQQGPALAAPAGNPQREAPGIQDATGIIVAAN